MEQTKKDNRSDLEIEQAQEIEDLQQKLLDADDDLTALEGENKDLKVRLERTAEILATLGVIGNTPHEKYRFVNA